MSRQNHLLHAHLASKRRLSLFDKIIIGAAFLYPLSALPQVMEIYAGNVEGVSLLSWLGFLTFSILFLAYGMIHKITPMIITNVLWCAVDGLVIIGLLTHYSAA